MDQREEVTLLASPIWSWIGSLASLAGLLLIWFGRGSSIGGGHYHEWYGLFQYYVVESQPGVASSAVRMPNLLVSLVASLILGTLLYSSIHNLARLAQIRMRA